MGWRSRLPDQQPATLVFDLDGTLLDVSARHHRVYDALCASMGGDPLDRTTYWRLKRLRAGGPQILGASGLPAEPFPALEFDAQIELPENLGFDVLFPAAIPLLTAATVAHTCVLVARRASVTALRAQLGVLAVRQYFEAIESAPRDG